MIMTRGACQCVARIWSQHCPCCTEGTERGQGVGISDDAILVEKYNEDYGDGLRSSTVGSVSVHVNSNRKGGDGDNENWVDFAVNWCHSYAHCRAAPCRRRARAMVITGRAADRKYMRLDLRAACPAGLTMTGTMSPSPGGASPVH